MSHQAGETFIHLDPEQEQAYQKILDILRTTTRTHPELALSFFLNGLVATGIPDTADQIQDWAETVCEFDARDRAALCHGNGPRPDRIVQVRSMEEIISHADL